MRRVVLVVAVVLVWSVASAGCASGSDAAKATETAQEFGPEMSVAEAYRAGEMYLPADSQVAYVSVHEGSGWDFLGDDLLPIANPNAEPGEPGSLEGVRADLERVSSEIYGFDIHNAEGLVVGISLDGSVGGILFGDFEEPKGLETAEVAGQVAYAVDVSAVTDDLGPLFPTTAYMTRVEGRRPGFAWQLHEESLAQVVDGAVPGGESEGFAHLFDGVEGARAALAANSARIAEMSGQAPGGPIPEQAVFGFSEQEISLDMLGDAQTLELIEGMIAQYVAGARGEVGRTYDERRPEGGMAGMLSAYNYHFVEAVAGQLEPTKGADRLRYDVKFGDVDSATMAMLAPAVAVGSQLAIGAFEQYILRSKMSEALGIVDRMSDGARRYFEFDQQWSRIDGAEPWHRADDDNDVQQTGMPVAFEDKVFPGGTNIRLVSAPQMPKNGEKVMTDMQLEGDFDFDAVVVAEALNLNLPEATYFRYVYETGPGTGADATATITAEANFDPSTPRHHRTVLEMEVIDGQVVAFPMVTHDEGQ